jgi:gas vesicle protein
VKAVTTESSTTNVDTLTYGQSPDEGASTPQVAKEQAAAVTSSAKDAGQNVAGVAKDEAKNVATEATRQAKDILGQTRTEISQQAADQQQRVAGGLRSLGTELGSMAERSDESGVASDLAQQASAKANELADWLEQRDPGSLLNEVTSFARRRPGVFLAIAVGAGLAAGRLTRGLKDESSGSSDAPASTPATANSGVSTTGYGTTAEYGTTTGYGASTGEYASPTGDEYSATGDEGYSPMGDGYSASDEFGTPPAAVGIVVDPVVTAAPLTERQYPESGSPLNEER